MTSGISPGDPSTAGAGSPARPGRDDHQAYEFVDAHHHFQDLSANYYPWLSDDGGTRPLAGDISRLKRNYLAEDLRRDLEGLDLIKSVHIQNGWDPADPAGETRWLQAECQRSGLPSAIIGFADLADQGVESLLEAHASCSHFRGIRQILKWHEKSELSFAARPDLVQNREWRSGYALLRRFGLSFEAQLFPSQMALLARLAADFPDIVLVINHAGMPVEQSAEGLSSWEAALKTLAGQPNVNIKLSGFGLYGGRDWKLESIGERLLRVIDIFGAERCMLGSNLPVETLYSRPRAIVDIVHWLGARLTLPEASAIRRFNAERIYRI